MKISYPALLIASFLIALSFGAAGESLPQDASELAVAVPSGPNVSAMDALTSYVPFKALGNTVETAAINVTDKIVLRINKVTRMVDSSIEETFEPETKSHESIVLGYQDSVAGSFLKSDEYFDKLAITADILLVLAMLATGLVIWGRLSRRDPLEAQLEKQISRSDYTLN